MERLNATQRRVYILTEVAHSVSEIWPIADALESRAKSMFPDDWYAEIRVTYNHPSCPSKTYRVMAYCDISIQPPAFKHSALYTGNFRADLGCWVPRCFKIGTNG